MLGKQLGPLLDLFVLESQFKVVIFSADLMVSDFPFGRISFHAHLFDFLFRFSSVAADVENSENTAPTVVSGGEVDGHEAVGPAFHVIILDTLIGLAH